MHELSKQFRFEAAHTLRRQIDEEPSRRIHGHSYRAEVTLRGTPDPISGMVWDLGQFEAALSAVRHDLDHRFLDEIQNLGPPTLENLSAWIWNELGSRAPGLHRVTVHRDSTGDACSYFGAEPPRS